MAQVVSGYTSQRYVVGGEGQGRGKKSPAKTGVCPECWGGATALTANYSMPAN